MKKKDELDEDKKSSGPKEVATLTNSYLMVDPNKLNGVLPKLYNYTDYNNFSRPTEDIDMSTGGLTPSTVALPDPIIGKHIQLPDGDTTVTALSWQAAGEQDSGWIRTAANDYQYLVNGSSVTEWLPAEFRVNYLTQGSVLFTGASGKVSQDNANFFWDASNVYLGIGTSSPSYRLESRSVLAQLSLSVDASNSVQFRASTAGLNVTHTSSGFTFPDYVFQGDSNNGHPSLRIYNTHTTGATSHAWFIVETGGSSAGDPIVLWDVDFATVWGAGIDNSDSDNWKLCESATLGTNTRLTVYTTTGDIAFGTGSFYWDNTLSQLQVGAVRVGSSTDYTLVSSSPLVDFVISSSTEGRLAIATSANQHITGSTSGDFCLRVKNDDLLISTNDGASAYFKFDTSANFTLTDISLSRVAGTNGGRLQLSPTGATESAQMQLCPGASVNPVGTITSQILLINQVSPNLEYGGLSWFSNELILDAAATGGGSYRPIGIYSSNINRIMVKATLEMAFNDTGVDYDHRFEGDTATNLLLLDASLDAVQIGTTTAAAIADFRSTSIVFNDPGADLDFRVEGDTDANLLFTDASADKVGIGMNNPSEKLHVTGNIRWSGVALGADGSTSSPSFSFSGQTGTGLWRNASACLSVALNTVTRFCFDGANYSTYTLVSVSSGAFGFSSSATDPTSGGDTFIIRSAAGVTRVGSSAQGAVLGYDGTNVKCVPSAGQLYFATAALGTTATTGFITIPSCAGAPTGVPANIPTGQVPMIWDSTNLQLYIYTGGAWKKSAVFT